VWYIRSVRANDDHEAKFPLELPMRLIRLLSNPEDIILDPFLGSGTTAVAAIKTGRRFIGIEIMPHYFELAKKNIEAEMSRHQLLDSKEESLLQPLF
jgi:DNA modification methylase